MYKKLISICIIIMILFVLVANYTFATTSSVESDSTITSSTVSGDDTNVITSVEGGGAFENEETKDIYTKFGEALANGIESVKNETTTYSEETIDKTINTIYDEVVRDYERISGKKLTEKEQEDIIEVREEKRKELKELAKNKIEEIIKKWNSEFGDTYENNANNITEWAKNKVGTTIEDGVDKLLQIAIKDPLNKQLDNLFGMSEDNSLGNIFKTTLNKYFDYKTQDDRNRYINILRSEAGLPELTEEIEKQDFDWAYEASKAALTEVNKLAYELGDKLEEEIEHILGGDFGAAIGDYCGALIDQTIKEQFERWASMLQEAMTGSKFTQEQIDEAIKELQKGTDQIAGKAKEDLEKEAIEYLEKAKEDAINKQFSQIRDEALEKLAEDMGKVAEGFVDDLFSKLDSQLDVFSGDFGKIANSFISGLVKQVKNWAGDNIKNAVTTYLNNWFFDKDGEIKFDSLKIDWTMALVDTLLGKITDENLSQLIDIAIKEWKKPGGTVGGPIAFEEYDKLYYMFMIKGSTLLPSRNNISGVSSSLKAVTGIAPDQFSSRTDSMMRYHAAWEEMITDAQATSKIGHFTVPGYDIAPWVNPGDSLNTTAILTPAWTTVAGGPVPYLSDAAYVMCEMDKNISSDSYVQRALSYTSIYTGTKFNLDFKAANLFAEAAGFATFTANAASHGGYGNAIKDLTDVATGRYNRQSKVYILGPFKVDYIRDFVYTARGKAEFGLMVDMNIYDQNGNVIPKNYWSYIYSDDTKQERRNMDEDYRFPYPGEDFYIALYNYGSNGITSISNIQLTYREMQVLVKFQMLRGLYTNYSAWFDTVIPHFEMGAPTFTDHNITAVAIPRELGPFAISVSMAHKYYLTHTQTITLHKKSAVGAYETAEFTTTSSTSISGFNMISSVYGGAENSELMESIKSVLGETGNYVGMYSSTGSKFFDSISQVYNIYNDAENETPLLDSLKAVLATYGKNDWAKILDLVGTVTNEDKTDFEKIVAVSNYFVKSDSMRKVIELGAMIYQMDQGKMSQIEALKYVAKEIGLNEDIVNTIDAVDLIVKSQDMDKEVVKIICDPNSSASQVKENLQKYIYGKDNLTEEEKKNLYDTSTKAANAIENSPYVKEVKDLYGKITNVDEKEVYDQLKDVLESAQNRDKIENNKEGNIQVEEKTKSAELSASEDDNGLTIEEAFRIFDNLYSNSRDKDTVFNTLISAYEKYDKGESYEDAVLEAYKENPTAATRAVSQFLDLIPHMTENELKSLTTVITKASDIEELTDVFNTYKQRQDLLTDEEKKEMEQRAFQETLEEAATLNDDSIYTEYNPKFTITNVERPTQVYWANDDEVGLTIGVAGVVWKDAHGGLENNYDGIRGANANGELETGIEGVKVTLIDRETNEIGKYYDSRNNLIDAITYTDEGGYYHIERIPVGEYDVEFEYDGQTYKTTEYMAGGNVADYLMNPDQEKYYNNSKAAEDPNERIEFNDKFFEISNGVAIGRDGTKTPLTYEKEGGVSKLVTLDSAGHVLPQFAMHARTSTNGLTYPLDDNFTIGENEDTLVLEGNQYTFFNTGEYMYHINLGLIERSKIDLATTQDVYNVVTTVNQKQETYKYNARGILAIYDARLKETDSYRNISYNRELYKADYEYRISDYKFNDLNKLDRNGEDKSAEIEKIQAVKTEDSEEKVFVTYKITIKNQSILQVATINELVDYFDPTYRLIQEDYYLDIQNDEGVPINTRVATQSYYETSSGFTQRIKWTETGKMGTDYYPGLNVVYTTDLQNYMLKAGEEIHVYMTFEVEKDNNSALYLGQKQNIVEITNYSSFEIGTVDKTFTEGLIDKDSDPGNTNPYAIDEYEDDTDAAPLLNLKLYETDGRTMDGYVWDDDRTKLLKTGQLVGDGLRQEDEDLLNGVRVQLIEKIDNPENGEEYEYVWKEMYTGDDIYSYVVNTGGSATFGGEVSDDGSIVSDTQMGAVARGQYKFNNYIAGNFIVRFIYGDTERTYLNDTEVPYTGEYAGIGDNQVSYNGQDYKSTAYQEGQNLYQEWYNLGDTRQNNKLMSDAKDDETRRKKVIEFSSTIQNEKAEILASFDTRSDKGYYDPVKHQALRDNTWMFADTARFNVKVEYNTDVENGLEPPTYRIKNVDFGLEQRPETKIELNKEIIGIKITLASGDIIIDTANGINKNVNWIDKQKIGVPGFEYKRDTFKYRYTQGTVHIYMDEEVQQGANIEITYRITITNNSQIDYTGDGDLGLAYYTGQSYDSDKIVTTTVDKIIDYVDNSLVFKESDNGYNGWKLIETMPEFMTDDYKEKLEQAQQQQIEQEEQAYGNYIEQQMSKYGEDYVVEHLDEFEKQYYEMKEQQNEELDQENVTLSNTEILNCMKAIGYLNPDLAIVKTKSARTEKQPITQVIVTKNTEKTALKPGENTTVDLVLSKTLSPQDEADTLSYENIAEILQLSNTVGRRDMDAVVGNQEPDEEPAEYDSDFIERITITPPTGENRAYYFVLGTIVLIILIGGIVLIKRKVLTK